MDLELDIIWQITIDYGIIWVYMYILQNNIIDLIWSNYIASQLAPLKMHMLLLPLTLCQSSCQTIASSMSPKRISSGGSSGRSSVHNDISDTTDTTTSRHPPEIEGKLLEALVLVVVVMALKLPEVGAEEFIGKENERMTWENVQMRWSWYHLMVISGMIDHNKQMKWYLQKSSWMVLVSSVCHRAVCANVCNFGWSKHLHGRRSPLLAASRLLPQHQLQDLQNLDHCQRQGSEKVSTGIKGSSGKPAKDLRKGSTHGGTPYCWLKFTVRFRFTWDERPLRGAIQDGTWTWTEQVLHVLKFKQAALTAEVPTSLNGFNQLWHALTKPNTDTLKYFKFTTPYIPGKMPGQLPQCYTLNSLDTFRQVAVQRVPSHNSNPESSRQILPKWGEAVKQLWEAFHPIPASSGRSSSTVVGQMRNTPLSSLRIWVPLRTQRCQNVLRIGKMNIPVYHVGWYIETI